MSKEVRASKEVGVSKKVRAGARLTEKGGNEGGSK